MSKKIRLIKKKIRTLVLKNISRELKNKGNKIKPASTNSKSLVGAFW